MLRLLLQRAREAVGRGEGAGAVQLGLGRGPVLLTHGQMGQVPSHHPFVVGFGALDVRGEGDVVEVARPREVSRATGQVSLIGMDQAQEDGVARRDGNAVGSVQLGGGGGEVVDTQRDRRQSGHGVAQETPVLHPRCQVARLKEGGAGGAIVTADHILEAGAGQDVGPLGVVMGEGEQTVGGQEEPGRGVPPLPDDNGLCRHAAAFQANATCAPGECDTGVGVGHTPLPAVGAHEGGAPAEQGSAQFEVAGREEHCRAVQQCGSTHATPPPGEEERARVMETLSTTPVSPDEIIRHTGLHAAQVFMVLLELDLAGRLERHAGANVSLIL